MIKYTGGVRNELRDQHLHVSNGKPPWWTAEFVYTFQENEYPDVVSSGVFVDRFCDKHLQGWTTQSLNTL